MKNMERRERGEDEGKEVEEETPAPHR